MSPANSSTDIPPNVIGSSGRVVERTAQEPGETPRARRTDDQSGDRCRTREDPRFSRAHLCPEHHRYADSRVRGLTEYDCTTERNRDPR